MRSVSTVMYFRQVFFGDVNFTRIIGLVPKIGMPMFDIVPNIRYYLVGYRVVLPISHKVANIWQVLVLPIFGNSNIWLAKYLQQTNHARKTITF